MIQSQFSLHLTQVDLILVSYFIKSTKCGNSLVTCLFYRAVVMGSQNRQEIKPSMMQGNFTPLSQYLLISMFYMLKYFTITRAGHVQSKTFNSNSDFKDRVGVVNQGYEKALGSMYGQVGTECRHVPSCTAMQVPPAPPDVGEPRTWQLLPLRIQPHTIPYPCV